MSFLFYIVRYQISCEGWFGDLGPLRTLIVKTISPDTSKCRLLGVLNAFGVKEDWGKE